MPTSPLPETEADGSREREGGRRVPGTVGLSGVAGGLASRPTGGALLGSDPEAE